MTGYTREAPFEFEGVKVWVEDGMLTVNDAYAPNADAHLNARAIHAFIEAERTGWHWTNADHTEARKGRWVALRAATCGDPDWSIEHDDFPVCTAHSMTAYIPGSWAERAQLMFESFLAWHAEQDVPEEPTGLGAVVEVEDEYGLVTYVRAFETDRPWATTDGTSESHWSALTDGAKSVVIKREGVK